MNIILKDLARAGKTGGLDPSEHLPPCVLLRVLQSTANA
jgi:hypothetical protein